MKKIIITLPGNKIQNDMLIAAIRHACGKFRKTMILAVSNDAAYIATYMTNAHDVLDYINEASSVDFNYDMLDGYYELTKVVHETVTLDDIG